MTKEREQFGKNFALIALDPGSWLEQAQGLRMAAKPILESLLPIVYGSQPHAEVRLEMLAYTRGYMLLTGFAFENLLKAIAAKRNLVKLEKGQSEKKVKPKLTFDASLSREKGGHSLTGLARDLDLGLTLGELQYLERLAEYIHWGGRYPVPMNLGVYEVSYSTRRLSWTTGDPAMGDALFDKLSAETATIVEEDQER